MPGNGFDDMELAIGADFSPFIKSFEQFNKNMQVVMRKSAGSGQANAFSKMLFSPNSKNATKKSFDASLGGAVGSMSSMMKSIGQNPAVRKGMGGGFFKEALADVKKMKKEMPGLKRELKSLAKDIKVAGRGSVNRGARAVGRGTARVGRKALGMGARAGLRAAGFLGTSVMGFVTGAYRQGIEAWQQTASSQLEGGPSMVGMTGKYGKKGAQFKADRYKWGSGLKMGYNAAEGAQIQSAAARAGIGGPGAAKNAFMMSRSLGPQGLEWGGGIMRRQGLSGGKGSDKAMRQLSMAMAIGVKTGLSDARLPELLQAGNEYAEQQIAITPDKSQYSNFMKEMGRIQLLGGPGMRGKYGAQAAMRADQGIKGAQGVQQSFLLRAFGFGKGTGLVDALKRQETGFAGEGPGGESNMMTIMKQLRQEYGAGKGGGLSEQGQLAFKGMNLGSLGMAQKFSNIYLKTQKGEMTSDEAKKRVSKIQETEKEAKYPAVALKAYRVVASFGGTAKILGTLFNKLAGFGSKEGMKFKKTIISGQLKAIEAIKPLFKSIVPLAKTMMGIVVKVLPKVVGVLGRVFGSIHLLLKVVMAFFSGFGKGKGVWSGMQEGWKSAKEFLKELNEIEHGKKVKVQMTSHREAISKRFSKGYKKESIAQLEKMQFLTEMEIKKWKARRGEKGGPGDEWINTKIAKLKLEIEVMIKARKWKMKNKPGVKKT